MNKTKLTIITLISLSALLITGTMLFILSNKRPNSTENTTYSTEQPSADQPQTAPEESDKDPVIETTGTESDESKSSGEILRDNLIDVEEVKGADEVQKVLDKYDSYVLVREFHDDYTDLDFTIYSAVSGEETWMITVTHLEEGVDIKEVLDMPNYEEDYEEELEADYLEEPYEEGPVWREYPIDVDTSKEGHTPDYTTRTKLNCAIEQLKQEYDTATFEVLSFGWSDNENAYVAEVLYGLQTVTFVEDTDGNVYRYFGEL